MLPLRHLGQTNSESRNCLCERLLILPQVAPYILFRLWLEGRLAKVKFVQKSLEEAHSFGIRHGGFHDSLARWVSAVDPNKPCRFYESLIPEGCASDRYFAKVCLEMVNPSAVCSMRAVLFFVHDDDIAGDNFGR